ncbi:hypothetical protein NDU88_004722 [Pleurodeles waltl]|uniref:Uncharacterized protein n=1 Tax=Pleurodeles waltl TaxID=8319 RepID=A0AAV7QJ78_PLEWA|nr:hypothetical protein NDU88_004722 [Pleurodeles waltl]
MRPHPCGAHYDISAGPAGGNRVSACRRRRDVGRHMGAGSKWSRRCCGRATGADAPIALFTVCRADSEKPHGALLRGPCTAHASGMGSAVAPRGPVTPRTTSLFLAVQTARKRLTVGGLVIPWAALLAALPWWITIARAIVAGNRRPRRCDRSASAPVVMTLEAPPVVGGASVISALAVLYRQG